MVMRWFAHFVLACCCIASVSGAPRPYLHHAPKAVSNGKFELGIALDAGWKRQSSKSDLPRFDLMFSNISDKPQQLVVTRGVQLVDDDAFVVVALIILFPDGEVVEVMPEVARKGNHANPFLPETRRSFGVSFWYHDMRFRNLLLLHDYRYSVTAVVRSMGLQSNTIAVNGFRVPRDFRPLEHARPMSVNGRLQKVALDALMSRFRKK